MDNSRSTSSPSRIRILVAAPSDGVQPEEAQRDDDAAWQDWQAARRSSTRGTRMALQRVFRGGEGLRVAVGLGYGETLRWFAPIDGADKRRMIIEYAGTILDADGFPEPPAALAAVAFAAAVSADPTSGDVPTTAGLVLLSHAETDLLALERARAE